MKSFKPLFIMALLAGFVSIALAEQTIPPKDAAKFVGQQKTVCGTVASSHYATRSKARVFAGQANTIIKWL